MKTLIPFIPAIVFAFVFAFGCYLLLRPRYKGPKEYRPSIFDDEEAKETKRRLLKLWESAEVSKIGGAGHSWRGHIPPPIPFEMDPYRQSLRVERLLKGEKPDGWRDEFYVNVYAPHGPDDKPHVGNLGWRTRRIAHRVVKGVPDVAYRLRVKPKPQPVPHTDDRVELISENLKTRGAKPAPAETWQVAWADPQLEAAYQRARETSRPLPIAVYGDTGNSVLGDTPASVLEELQHRWESFRRPVLSMRPSCDVLEALCSPRGRVEEFQP